MILRIINVKRKACFLSVILFFTGICIGLAQEKIKFGEVPLSDLTMTVYPDDTTAAAVTLHEECEVRYDIVNNDFQAKFCYTVRMKVLKPAGLDRANIFIPFYTGNTNAQSERISGINGYTYNMVGGKTERTKLSKEYIFEEKTSDNNMQRMKIAFPNVKVGSVFELKYEKTSPYYKYLDDFIFQRSIPVKYSRYQVTIPEYFNFRKRTGGCEKIDYSEKTVPASYSLGGGSRLIYNTKEMTFVVNNLPAIQNDSHVWNINNFLSRVTVDLLSVSVPGVIDKDYEATWEDIDTQLMEDEQFGRQLSISNLMKVELAAVLKDDMSPNDKVVAILELVRSKIRWNEEDVLYINNVRKAIEEGKGSSAEMNAALICLLRDAGFDAFPVVMSMRSRGRIFPPSPNQKALNYFLTGVYIDDRMVYLDASYKYGMVNMIPVDCMVQEAHCIFKDKPGIWVDLHELGRNTSMNIILAGFNEDGHFSGTVQRRMTGTPCVSYSQKVDKQKSVDDTRTELETELNVRISNLEQGEPQNATLIEKFSFESTEISLGSEFIYLNSLIFPYIKENPFKAETRILPVEYPYPYDHSISVTLTMPDGYELNEAPASETFNMSDKQISVAYQTQKIGTNVQITQRITVRQTLYPATEYQHLRDLWARIADKNNAQLVLKRVAQ